MVRFCEPRRHLCLPVEPFLHVYAYELGRQRVAVSLVDESVRISLRLAVDSILRSLAISLSLLKSPIVTLYVQERRCIPSSREIFRGIVPRIGM